MPQTYAFQVSQPVTDTAPRNRISATLHFQHVLGGLLDTDLKPMCDDIAAMWQTRYGISNCEVQVKAYDVGAKPNYPRAATIVNVGLPWACAHPREVALCLSYAGENRGNKSERGRTYLMPSIAAAAGGGVDLLRPNAPVLDWALKFYTEPNASLPDIGGVDWQFGIYSPTYGKFTQARQAWVNDEWDTQRRRGLRETTRVTSGRVG